MNEDTTPITVSFIWTLDVMKTAQAEVTATCNLESNATKLTLSQSVFIYSLLTICVAAAVYVLAKDWEPPRQPITLLDYIVYGLPLILLLVLFPVSKYIQKKSLDKSFAQLRFSGKRLEYVFSQSGVVAKCESVFEGKNEWNGYIKAVRTKKGLLLYTQPNLGTWIPFHAFQSQADADAAVELAKRFIPKFFED
jgi:hypothetical protein